ncbi:symmetrical bis(5'-nucleosyl)-tetraphosphatase [Iodobacter fluviatilis]|uniref:bis(5'-nucleosyl)-tetraphosphatase (symmetrical) n=1 Tax=Iodobacter fluviatilis TaxID=537 RepID=A0A377SXE4_9NEIS|nr:symmetrical bis(5'-nucleosyl)-tetraphosphatase [Iodobacter fluviatilis]TCU83313.1 bis(5'nucleosyl)-tetraphosphatase ApaH [Iodobacter fluviatilis]STR45970.1 Bis(5'-nucleosyl)-tetraphosphatase, symmetrical [Iodobacter fluviatilis]
MSRYAIGDIQGCFTELLAVVENLAFNPKNDQIYLLGDLVNRGPSSLATLRWASQTQGVSVVLGNHDLHLLAMFAGLAQAKPGDTLQEVIDAPDAENLLLWLRQQPLLIDLGDVVLVHAGVSPCWSLDTAKLAAKEVESALQSDQWKDFMAVMYGNQPAVWSDDMSSADRMRYSVNCLTRMRFVTTDGALQLKYKGEREQAPAGIKPWFELANRQPLNRRVICGHWSALGLMLKEDVWALDTGCVWGGALTAISIDNGQLYQTAARSEYQALMD